MPPETTPQPTATPAPGDPETRYRRRRSSFESEAAALRSRSARVGQARLAAFVGSALCLGPALVGTDDPRTGWLAAAGALFALFLGLVAWDRRLTRRIGRLEELRDANARGLARIGRSMDRLPPCPPAAELLAGSGGTARPTAVEGGFDEAHRPDAGPPPFVRDLHLFGPSSLFRLLSTARTPTGRQTLARWLANPAEPDEIVRRQEAVRRLAGALNFRQELEAAGAGVPDRPPDLERFYRWAEGEPWLARHRWRLWTARALTVAIPGGLVACLFGLAPWDLWALVAFGGYLLSAASAGDLHEIYDHATAGGDGLRGYAPMFERLQDPSLSRRGEGGAEGVVGGFEGVVGGFEGVGGGLEGVRADERRPRDERSAPSEGSHIAAHMTRLERLTVLADTRRGLMHFFVQVFLLWDFHVATAFERWQRRAGPSVRRWLDELGEVEALCSLSGLAHDHQDWTFPTIDPDADTLTGQDLGHPLIPDDRRVGNDVDIGPPGTFLLVTGSNMSGKTTLLRAVGTNAVLAEAGGPVCAAALTLPPVRLATSVVVEDSLEEGVSFFMAELLRLKSVVDAAEEESRNPGRSRGRGAGRKVLYLLDEVLRGTNSAERRVAIRRVLHRLLELDAIGAITTHDLELSTPEEATDGHGDEVARAAVPIHFRETIHPRAEGGAEMTFDFIARPGIAPTTNALRLLEAVGLGKPGDDSEPPLRPDTAGANDREHAPQDHPEDAPHPAEDGREDG